MKKELNIINTYINTVSKGIRDRKVKSELKDELLSHLLEIYERNVALGLSDEDAQKDAVKHMGDSEAVAKTFKKLYPISSADYFKSAAWQIVYPLLFYFALGTIRVVRSYLFTLILFSALIKIRKVNKYFNTAFILSGIHGIFQIITFVIQCAFVMDLQIVKTIFLIQQIVVLIIYTLIICGILKAKKKMNEPKADFVLAIVSLPLVILSALLTFFVNNDYETEIGLLTILINILPAIVIYTSIRDLDSLKISISHEKHTAKILVSIVLALVILLSGINGLYDNILSNNYEAVNYLIEDTQSDVTEIKDKLIAMGLPQKIADELPESEIIKYKDAEKLEIEEENAEFIDDLSINHYTSYFFTINSSNADVPHIRILIAIDKFEDFSTKRYTEFFIDFYRGNACDLFCKMLFDIDGITKEIEPIHIQPIEAGELKHLHYIFPPTKSGENHRGYIAQTIIPDTETASIGALHQYSQSSMFEINNPFESYWIRTFGYESLSAYIDNPIYIPPPPDDSVSDEVPPLADGSIGFVPPEDITDIDELIEYWYP